MGRFRGLNRVVLNPLALQLIATICPLLTGLLTASIGIRLPFTGDPGYFYFVVILLVTLAGITQIKKASSLFFRLFVLTSGLSAGSSLVSFTTSSWFSWLSVVTHHISVWLLAPVIFIVIVYGLNRATE